jgi:hypothetical protein
LDFGPHQVDGIFVDDYPTGRDDNQIRTIAEHYGYNRIVLHQENTGLTGTWAEVNRLLADKEYDYIWQQEDDVELLAPLKIDSCISLLEQNKNIVQVSMKRQNWYPGEENKFLEPDDLQHERYLYNLKQQFFWTMASCYPYWISQEPIEETMQTDPSEAIMMSYLIQKYNGCSAVLKQNDGMEMVRHIGEVTKGKRISRPGDPSYERFLWMDPDKRYNARSGAELDNMEGT